MIRDVVRDTVRDVVKEELTKRGIIISEGNQKIQTKHYHLRVGKHIFEGYRFHKIKKVKQ